MIIICIIEISLVFLYSKIMFKMKKIQEKVEKTYRIYSKAEICNIISSKSLSIRYGNYYAYNPRKNEVLIKEKNSYNLWDIFAIYHEIGHYHDNLKNKIILKHMSVTCLNRLVIIPIFIFITVLRFFCKDEGLLFIYLGTVFLCSALIIHRFYFIIKYETSASKDAVINLSNFDGEVDLHDIKRAAYYAVISQGLFVLICMIQGGIMIDSTFYIAL